ncbi:MAG: cell division protein SepF [Fusobacteriaceae bacterium]|jgi:cell division inhibitor SepF|nr:cell division protein SepF [Fusobacteriaceae bacterium]
MEIVFIRPGRIEDCEKCIPEIKSNKIMLINLSDVENDKAQRIINYLSGAMYMQEGLLKDVAERIFCTIPRGVKHSYLTNEDEEPEITIDR